MMTPNVKTAIEEVTQLYSNEIPADVLNIIVQEKIILQPLLNCSEKYGRIEFLKDEEIFVIYGAELNPVYENSIIRFSLSHELGHYFIKKHRLLLLKGVSHDSKSGFICDNKLEKEADEFASNLLIPQEYFNQKIKGKKYLNLHEIKDISNECKASLTCSAIKYIKSDVEVCAVVISNDTGDVIKYWPSQSAHNIKLSWLGQKRIPPSSPTYKASQNIGVDNIFEARTFIDSWYSERKVTGEIWEQAYPLGKTGFIISDFR